MYWPAGAPKIHTASNSNYAKTRTIKLEDEEESFIRIGMDMNFKKDTKTTDLSEIIKEDKKNNEQNSGLVAPVTPDTRISSISPIDNESSWKNNEVNCFTHSDDQSLLSLKISRNGHIFATITSNTLTVWQTKPTAVLAKVFRSRKSLKAHGSNVSLLMRPDSSVFAVLTTNSYLITYTLFVQPNARAYKRFFSKNTNSQTRIQKKFSGIRNIGKDDVFRGPGEGDGALEISFNFELCMKINASTGQALALDDELVVATREPGSVQCFRWISTSSERQINTLLFSKIDWLPEEVILSEMIHDCPMNLSTWITRDGKAYAVQKLSNSKETNINSILFRGFCFHTPKSPQKFAIKAAINARFSLIAIGCVDGTIQIYTVRDYAGNIPPSHISKTMVSEQISGNLTCLTYSPDGYCLFAGYEKGWAMWSVFGKPGATSFGNDNNISREQNETWLEGVREAVWLGSGLEILMISRQDHRIWILELARSAITSCYGSANTSRMLIQTNSTISIYRGYDVPDLSSISTESSLWHVAQIPSAYLADQWPMRYLVTSSDGRYIAVAGRRGLTHYSVSSRRWRTFSDETMENEFQIRGGMCWHQHILIAAIEAEKAYQIRLFSREADLNISSVLYIESLPAPVVLIAPSGEDSLLVYTHDNILYHYIFLQSSGNLRITQVGQIAFYGIVRSPARVRGLSWILPDDELLEEDPSKGVACATVLFLVDGKLVLLQPFFSEERELRYDMRVIAQNVEYYVLMRDTQTSTSLHRNSRFNSSPEDENNFKINLTSKNCLSNSLWIFEGNEMKGWVDIEVLLQATPSEMGKELLQMVSIPIDFYPLSIILEKGIIFGLESELIQRQDVKFSLFRFTIRTHLLIPHVLQFHLSGSDDIAALSLAQSFEDLNYFSHSLETLLHNVLDLEVDTCPPSGNALLPTVISFLSSFPQYLDIIVKCTRKTEVRSWHTLFKYLPPPQELFEEALRIGSLKTAAGYMIIVQTLEEMSTSSEQLILLFQRAKDEGDWTLCKELANFFIALDPSGDVLRGAMEMLDLKGSVIEDEKKSFLLEKFKALSN